MLLKFLRTHMQKQETDGGKGGRPHFRRPAVLLPPAWKILGTIHYQKKLLDSWLTMDREANEKAPSWPLPFSLFNIWLKPGLLLLVRRIPLIHRWSGEESIPLIFSFCSGWALITHSLQRIVRRLASTRYMWMEIILWPNDTWRTVYLLRCDITVE